MARERKTLSDAVMKRFMADPTSLQTDQPTTTVPLTAIQLPARQPRRYFDPEKMAQLVISVQEYGILEPILVRPIGTDTYELVAGERRLRAAKTVGLTEIPIAIRDFSDQEALQVSLMENLQREDLNPIEETEAVLELLTVVLGVSTEEVKSAIYQAANAKNRRQDLKGNVSLQIETIESLLAGLGRFNLESFRSSRLPLLNLPNNVLDALRGGKLEYTKARTIARVSDTAQRDRLLEQAVSSRLSLSEIKTKVKETKPVANAPVELTLQPTLRVLPDQLLFERFTDLAKRLRRSELWSDPNKRERLTSLLNELEALAIEE
jgi:ParB family transcriptional regulator, chromosome partitioning protein